MTVEHKTNLNRRALSWAAKNQFHGPTYIWYQPTVILDLLL